MSKFIRNDICNIVEIIFMYMRLIYVKLRIFFISIIIDSILFWLYFLVILVIGDVWRLIFVMVDSGLI